MHILSSLTDIGLSQTLPISVILKMVVRSIMIVYENLWETMKNKGVTQYALIKKYGVSPGQITRLKRGESVSTNTINMFCEILQCNVEDIMQYKAK